jgi:hypothetical protein
MYYIHLTERGVFQVYNYTGSFKTIGGHFPATYLGPMMEREVYNSNLNAQFFPLRLPDELMQYLGIEPPIHYVTASNPVARYLLNNLIPNRLQIFRALTNTIYSFPVPKIENYAT